jgi:hypothetical protein
VPLAGAAATEGRKVISEATLSLRAEHPARAAEEAGRIAAEHGGYVATKETEQSNDTVVKVDMVLRLPAAALETSLAALRGRGTILSEAQSGRDVTEEYVDTEASLRAKRKLEERLLAIVERSQSVKDLLDVEQQLSNVRGDIERLDGHARALANQVAFATVHLSLSAPAQPLAEDAESAASKVLHAFAESGRVFVAVMTGMIVATGALIPLAIPALGLLLAVRHVRKRRASLPAPALVE